MQAFGGKGRSATPPLRPLVLLDSDGCVLDSMDIKQKTIFAPAFISHFGLEDISEAALQVWEFVSLHSRSRGANRFVLLLRALDLLRDHPSVTPGSIVLPDLTALRNAGGDTGQVTTSNLSELAELADLADLTERSELAVQQQQIKHVLAWSRELDRGVHDEITTVTTYEGVPDIVAEVAAVASVAIVSQTPETTLRKEWDHAGLLPHVDDIYGQIPGGKAAVLQKLTVSLSTTEPDRPVLMIGDAPGDLEATRNTPVRFYPIIPGRERESWSRFASDVLYPFVNGDYTDTMQNSYVKEFMAALPEEPTWKKS